MQLKSAMLPGRWFSISTPVRGMMKFLLALEYPVKLFRRSNPQVVFLLRSIPGCLAEKLPLQEWRETSRLPFLVKPVLNREWQKILMERAAS